MTTDPGSDALPSRITWQLEHYARRSARPWLGGCTAADLRQEGALAWLRTLARADATRGDQDTYAEARIQGAIADAVRTATHRGKVRYVPLNAVPVRRSAPVEPEVWLRELVAQLPALWQQILWKRYGEGWGRPELAAQLGMTKSALWWQEERALRQLRQLLEKEEG